MLIDDYAHPIVSYTFDFGDGSSPVTQSTAIVTYRFAQQGTYTVSVTVTDTNSVTGVATQQAYPGSTYTPTTPVRVLDTRTGGGLGWLRPLVSGETVTLPVAGLHGVPASGVTAVVLNVTVIQPTVGGFLTVYPDGQPLPGVSNLNFAGGETIPNLVVVPVVNGKVNFYNPAGNLHVIADLFGYYTG